MTRLISVVFFSGLLFGTGLAAVKAEPNLEKRSEKALFMRGNC